MLTGGSGADTFLFIQGSADDVITDFSAPAGDLLDVTAYEIDGSNFGNVLGEDSGGAAVLALTDDDSITLAGVSADSLTADAFVPI